MSLFEFEIRSSWDGGALGPGEESRISLRLEPPNPVFSVLVESAFYDDPKPPHPSGSTDRLWEYEVVEIFLLGDDEGYLEIELGPHGHYLVLRLDGRRQVVKSGIPIEYSSHRQEGRWTGEARISLDWLPDPLRAANAYAIHGVGASRRYLAANAVPGPAPDFHRLEYFEPLQFTLER